jgi:hypothetical protein
MPWARGVLLIASRERMARRAAAWVVWGAQEGTQDGERATSADATSIEEKRPDPVFRAVEKDIVFFWEGDPFFRRGAVEKAVVFGRSKFSTKY